LACGFHPAGRHQRPLGHWRLVRSNLPPSTMSSRPLSVAHLLNGAWAAPQRPRKSKLSQSSPRLEGPAQRTASEMATSLPGKSAACQLRGQQQGCSPARRPSPLSAHSGPAAKPGSFSGEAPPGEAGACSVFLDFLRPAHRVGLPLVLGDSSWLIGGIASSPLTTALWLGFQRGPQQSSRSRRRGVSQDLAVHPQQLHLFPPWTPRCPAAHRRRGQDLAVPCSPSSFPLHRPTLLVAEAKGADATLPERLVSAGGQDSA